MHKFLAEEITEHSNPGLYPASSKKPSPKRPKSRVLSKFLSDKLSLIALLILIIITLAALGADVIAGQFLHQQRDTIDSALLGSQGTPPPFPPGIGNHALGTDEVVRDVLARTLYAGQVSLSVGYLTALIVALVGGSLGLIAGYFGGWLDDLINAVIQILLNLPVFFLMIILSFIVQFDILAISLTIGLLSWMRLAQLVRGQVISLKQREFIEAARAVGANSQRIMLVHLTPNVVSLALTSLGFDVASAILQEAGLSFLGFGVTIPVPSWGNQIAESARHLDDGTYLFTRAPWLIISPAVMMAVSLLCIYLVANGLRDAFDPNLRGTK